MFGGGKTIRESMLQGIARRGRARHRDHRTSSCSITGASSSATSGSRTAGSPRLGKAGNPDVMDGVDPALEIGPTTEIIAGEGRILTAGGIDGHVHFICPQIVDEAVAAGMTTLIGGGTGPAEGTRATTCTPSPWAIREMLLAMDECPVNVLLLGKGNTVSARGAARDGARRASAASSCTRTGARRPRRSTPACAPRTRPACRWRSTPTRSNEAGYVQTTLAAIGGRSIHAYHTEGAGGGHAPDIITVASQPNVLPGLDQPDAPAHGQHRRRAPRHADRLPPPQPAHPGGPRVRRVAASAARRSPPRTSCTTSARSR